MQELTGFVTARPVVFAVLFQSSSQRRGDDVAGIFPTGQSSNRPNSSQPTNWAYKLPNVWGFQKGVTTGEGAGLAQNDLWLQRRDRFASFDIS